MLKNILKISLRSFVKERFYASINIFGLAVGIATSLLISLYVVHETSFDKQHKDVDQLYRVNMTNIWMPGGGQMSSSVVPLADVLTSEYPEVEDALRINTPGNYVVSLANKGQVKSFYENDILAADSNFFEFFNFELLYGDPATALYGHNKVVISQEIALKYFDKLDVVGETLLLGDGKRPLEITGVTKTQPTNIHFDFDFLLSMPTNGNIKNFEWSWIWSQVVTYVKLRPDANVNALEEKFKAIAPKYAPSALERLYMDYDNFMADKGEWSFYLQPVQDIHLHSVTIGNRLGTVSDISYVYIFVAAAFFILLLAVINFVNLSTARAAIRAKEVGIRKVMGSLKRQLIGQFLIESLVMSLIAGIIGLGIMEFLRIMIESYLGTIFHTTIWSQPLFFVLLIGCLIAIGLLAGLYPAFYLTAFEPAKVLKGQLRTGKKSKAFRNSLVVLQFTISIALMICTTIVYQQLDYFNKKDLGYNRDNVIVVNWAHKLKEHLKSYKEEVLQHPNVRSASVSMDVIGRGSWEDLFIDEGSGKEQTIAMMKADERQLETMGVELLYGRFFDEDRPADDHTVVINEATMRLFDWTEEDVLGQKIKYAGDDMGAARVIGVVKDFNFYTFRYPIAPYIFFHIDAPIWGDQRVLTIKTNGQHPGELLSFLESEWKEAVNDSPFQYSFLDEEYENQYKEEQRLGALFAVFTVIAMFIACLGLFGLASYTIGQRSKEIGIRKVLGASVARVTFMINGSFTKLIIVSIVLAIPLAWWVMGIWLDQFVYKIDIAWWVFVATGVLAILVAWLTVGYQSLRAATLNPAETLKDE